MQKAVVTYIVMFVLIFIVELTKSRHKHLNQSIIRITVKTVVVAATLFCLFYFCTEDKTASVGSFMNVIFNLIVAGVIFQRKMHVDNSTSLLHYVLIVLLLTPINILLTYFVLKLDSYIVYISLLGIYLICLWYMLSYLYDKVLQNICIAIKNHTTKNKK